MLLVLAMLIIVSKIVITLVKHVILQPFVLLVKMGNLLMVVLYARIVIIKFVEHVKTKPILVLYHAMVLVKLVVQMGNV